MCSIASSAPCFFQDLDDERVAFPDGLAEELRREDAPSKPCGIEEPAGGIDRAIDRQAVLHADDIVFLAMAGSGVDGAGSLLQRDVIGDHAERSAIDERMPENGLVEFVAVEAREDLPARSSRTSPPSRRAAPTATI